MSQPSNEQVCEAVIAHPQLPSPIHVKFYPHEDPSKARGFVRIPIPEGPVKDTLEAVMLAHIRNGVHFVSPAYLHGVIDVIRMMHPEVLVPEEKPN